MLCPNCKRYSGKSGDFCPKCGAFIPSDNSKYYDYNCAGEDDGSGLYKKLKPKPRAPVSNYRSYDPSRTTSQTAPRPVNKPNTPFTSAPRPVNNPNTPFTSAPGPAQGTAQQAPASQPNGQFGRPYVKKNGANPAAFIAIAVILICAFLPSMLGVISRVFDIDENSFGDELFTTEYFEEVPDIKIYGTHIKMDNMDVLSVDVQNDMLIGFSFTADFYTEDGEELILLNSPDMLEQGYIYMMESGDSTLYYNDGVFTAECYYPPDSAQTISEIILFEYDEFGNIVDQFYTEPSEDENTLIFSENNEVIVTSAN